MCPASWSAYVLLCQRISEMFRMQYLRADNCNLPSEYYELHAVFYEYATLLRPDIIELHV